MNAILSRSSFPKISLTFHQIKKSVRMTSALCVKPPVILVVEEVERKSTNLLTQIKNLVRSEKYLVYPATCTTLTGQPWQEETELLVLGVKLTGDPLQKVLLRWLQAGGKVLDFASNQGCLGGNHGSYFEAGSLGSAGLAALVESKLGIEVAKEEEEVAILSSGFLVSSTREFLDSLPNSSPPIASSGLIFRPTPDVEPSISLVPVLEARSPDFNSSLYREALATKVLGQVNHFRHC